MHMMRIMSDSKVWYMKRCYTLDVEGHQKAHLAWFVEWCFASGRTCNQYLRSLGACH